MEGLVKEAIKHTIDDAPDRGPVLDAAIVAQYQRMTHYGITGFVLFLDIQMPGLTGIQVARIAGAKSHVVFITAYDQYAIQAFEQGARHETEHSGPDQAKYQSGREPNQRTTDDDTIPDAFRTV